jgi:hypothetical protein
MIQDLIDAKDALIGNWMMKDNMERTVFHIIARKVMNRKVHLGNSYDNPEWTKILKIYGSPFHEKSLFKGIPATPENEKYFSDLFSKMKKDSGLFKGYRLRRRYRGPRIRGRSTQQYCLKEDGTSFALYLHEDK